MKVVHVVAGLNEADGGPSHTLPELWRRQQMSGAEVTVCSTRAADEAVAREIPFVNLYPRVFPQSLKRSPALAAALREEMASADLCHNHGCWLHPNWAAASASRRLNKPLVISPLGHLDPWSLARHPWRKRAVRFLVEGRNWRSAAAFIAKSAMEAEALKRLGLNNRVEIIPNGIDSVQWKKEVSSDEFFERFPKFKGQRLLLFLSRLHPKKGADLLLKSWERIRSSRPEWRLVMVGEGEATWVDGLRHFVRTNGLEETVLFTGSLEGSLKRSALAAAELFVLPSHSENFGQVVLEALAAARPVVVTQGCPWPDVETRGCGWWIGAGGSALIESLRRAMSLSATELAAMGRAGSDWVLRDFDWDLLIRRHLELYQEVIER